jgi:oligopeptide transport system substrate-binding protein
MRRYRRTVGAVLALALALTACNGDDGDDGTAADGTDTGEVGEEGEAQAGGEFSIHNCEPQSLIPANSTEVCGSKVLGQLFSGLYENDPETFEPIPVMAESLESDDAQNWTLTIRDDFTFHNGDPVTAQHFVDAWNFAVDPDNAMQNATFFANFAGFDEVQDGAADELEGVSAVDDTTIEIELSEPFAALEPMLAYTAFFPMPDEAYDDIEAFESAPVGNGRFEIDGEWEHNQRIAMTRYEDWPGDNPALADRVVWEIYEDINTAYLDVQAGELDILDGIPPEREGDVDNDFGDDLVRVETSAFTFLGFPLYDERFEDPEVRQAFSMAIDRQAIIDAIFDGARVPATSVIPPVLESFREGICEACEFDPDAAAEMLEEAGGFEGTLDVYFNSGAGHEEWVEAVAGQWQDNLGIEDVNFESLEFAQYLDLLDEREITGPFRLGWVLSYGSSQYALEPIYSTGASSNYYDYSSEEFDDLIAEANSQTELDEAEALYQEAEEVLVNDMPNIPMWFETRTTVHSDRVSDVVMDPRTFVRVESVSVND